MKDSYDRPQTVSQYFETLARLLSKISSTDASGTRIFVDAAVTKVIKEIILRNKRGNKIMLIGNGGSSAIANHIATDLLKNAQLRALTFTDPSLLTCVSNDLGYEFVFSRPLSLIAKKNDILFSISSSGNSKNILNATRAARKIGCFVITLSGFKENNCLRKMGNVNFYIPSDSYGYVETVHAALCHYLVDILVKHR